MKINDELNSVILGAFYEARQEHHEFVTPEHILYASLFSEEGADIILACGGDIEVLKDNLKTFFKEHIPKSQKDEVEQSLNFRKVIDSAALKAASAGKKELYISDVMIAFYDLKDSFAAYYLKEEGIEKSDLINYVSHGISAFPDDYLMRNDFENDEVSETDSPKEKFRLDAFTTDLTALARENKLEILVGRESEIERTMQVLCRRTKNNPIHVGDPGVGKTAITEGLAQMIAKGNVPELLKNAKIFRLDMGSMLAGTKFRGDFEERMKLVLNALAKIDNVIVFIDEIHTIVGAGAVSGGSMDAANILKPVLTGGRIKVIGSTTFEEYRKFFEKDHALARRFQKIDIVEPTIDETYKILLGLREKYESHHGIKYSDSSLRAAVELSAKYIFDRKLPDKAIDIIDEAGAFARIIAKEKKIIDNKDIERVVSKIANIPEKTISSGESEKLKFIEDNLKKVIFGQDSAIKLVSEAIKRSRAGFGREEKPVASFLFVGPTGVGKTELAKQLALELGIPIHRFDMSEYQEKHTVARLIGAPPGYVGYEEGGLLTEAVRKTPHAVLLLDEIEKAHSDIFNTLLQIMDYATLTDNTGRKADFRNIIIIMTSNAGAREIGKAQLGFGQRNIDSTSIGKAVDRIFSPEFRNRLDKVVTFNHLPKEMILRVIKKEIADFAEKLKAKSITLTVSKKAYEWFAEKGFSREFGAREVGRIIQDNLKNFFVDEILFGSLINGGKAKVDVKNNEIKIET